jgi:hypothetical protein
MNFQNNDFGSVSVTGLSTKIFFLAANYKTGENFQVYSNILEYFVYFTEKTIENLRKEWSIRIFFLDPKFRTTKQRYPKLITIRSILNFCIVNFAPKGAAHNEKLL